MSIYRRTDRVLLNDVAFSAEPSTPVAKPAGTGVVLSQNDEDWSKKRSAEPVNGLLRPTINWMSSLPQEVVPNALLAKFPRIGNLLAVLWDDPNSARRYLDDLLVDKRGNRQGFPLDILRELLAMRAYYEHLHPESAQPWQVMNKSE